MVRSVVHPAAMVTFALLLGAVSTLALTARRREGGRPETLDGWCLADRGLGTAATWFLLGGGIYTAYTFVAVPGLVFSVGALGMFALAYTILVYPIALLVLPRLWEVATRNGCITAADVVRARLGSPGLALAVALTGILATMPYVALQVLGLRALLTAMGVAPSSVAGDLILTGAFACMAAATYRSGLRAAALVSVVKGVFVFGVAVGLVTAVVTDLGSPASIFASAREALAARAGGQGDLLLAPSLPAAYASLAVGSALALLVYPHVLTCVFAARSADVLRRNCVLLPAWTLVLGLFGVLGVAAIAAGVRPPAGSAELALPLLVAEVLPAALTGLVFGVLAVGALVPAAIMAIAAASLFTRNVWLEHVNPGASEEQQVRVARWVSVLVKFGALAFVFGLRTQDAINLQLLGGVWILQTFPAVVFSVVSQRLHHVGLLVGWALGMMLGTVLLALNDFVSVATLQVAGAELPVYIALLALVLNATVAVALSVILDRAGVGRGMDATRSEELARGLVPAQEWFSVDAR